MKTVLFVPGYYEGLNDRDYKEVINKIESKNYKVVFVSINWARTTIRDWNEQFDKIYAKYNAKDTILAGFSYGAMIAFCAASKRNPSQLWLFSLSPDFSEDLPMQRKSHLADIGHRRVSAFAELSFSKLVKNIYCKTLLFLGDIEAKKYPNLLNRAKEAKELIKSSRLFIVKDSAHDVTNTQYVKCIINNI